MGLGLWAGGFGLRVERGVVVARTCSLVNVA